jgi:hypothetical protein
VVVEVLKAPRRQLQKLQWKNPLLPLRKLLLPLKLHLLIPLLLRLPLRRPQKLVPKKLLLLSSIIRYFKS